MSTLNYTLIDADDSANRDDSSIEADPGNSRPGNAIQVYQFDAAAGTEYELVRATSGTEPEGTGEGLIMIGDPSNISWVSLTKGDTPDGSGSEQRVNVDGALRSRGYIDEVGRDIVGLLDNLLPSAPDLQTYDATTSGSPGKIGANSPSFLSQNDLVSEDGDKTADPTERGVITNPLTFTGALNFDVPGTDVYSEDAFGPGDRGHLEIVINGNRPSGTEDEDNTNDDDRYFDLTDLSGNDTTGGGGSGFDIDPAQNVTFSNGETYNEGYERTGDYFLDFGGTAFSSNDVNKVEVRHYINGSVYSSTNTQRVFIDDDGNNLSFGTTGSPIGSLTLNNIGEGNGGKSLSGIDFAFGATAPLGFTVDNVFRTSYSNSGSGIDFPTTNNCALTNAQIPDNSDVGDTLLVANQSTGSGEVGGTDDLNNNVLNARAGQDGTFNDGPNKVIQGDFEVDLQVLDPIEGSANSGVKTGGFNLLVDSVKEQSGQSNWELEEEFIIEGENQHSGGGEGTRIQEGKITFGSDVSDGAQPDARYDPTEAIAGTKASSPYDNELQVYDRQLVYPEKNFTSNFNPTTSDRDYSGAGGPRKYVGFAEDKSSNTKNFAIAVNASASTLVKAGTLSSGTDEVSLEMRIGGQDDTGWLDVTVAVDNGGCFASTNGNNQSFNGNDIGIIMSAFSGADGAGGRIFYRFTFPENGDAVIDDVEVTYNP